ncbi:MAG: FAD-binding oxidoreductase [Pseudomonadota bacterium]
MQRRQFLQSSLAAALTSALPFAHAKTSLKYVPTTVKGDIQAVTGDGSSITLKASDVQDFSNRLKSHLLLPHVDGYDKARLLLNPTFDKHPALIAQPTGVADVQSAVNFAREHKLLVAVKCGGHSASGKSTCDGGLQIDLSKFHGVRVDPKARTARVDGGSLLGELDHESMAHGLVTTAGTVSHTGVGGLTLGGGFGRLGRRFGMTIDNLLEMDVVTPDGQLRRAAPDENPDLYWALRGGGGNFGVVTSFLFGLHPMQREVVRARFSYAPEKIKQVLRFFGEYSQEIPDDMELNAGVFAPPGGAPTSVSLNVVFSGDPARLNALLAPIRKAGKPAGETISTLDYVALQRSGDSDDPRANGSYQKSGFIGAIDGKMVDAMVDNFDPKPNRVTWFAFQQSGGAISRVAPDATAFAHRESSHNMLSMVAWKFGADPEEHIADIRRYWSNIEPYTRGFYSNDLFDESQQQVNANYRQNFPRLLKVKNAYDPDNLFRLNANIAPS